MLIEPEHRSNRFYRNPRLVSAGLRPDTRGDTDLGRLNGARLPEEDLGRTSQTFFHHPQDPKKILPEIGGPIDVTDTIRKGIGNARKQIILWILARLPHVPTTTADRVGIRPEFPSKIRISLLKDRVHAVRDLREVTLK